MPIAETMGFPRGTHSSAAVWPDREVKRLYPRSPERKQDMQSETAARKAIGFMLPVERQFNERTTVERVNSRLNA